VGQGNQYDQLVKELKPAIEFVRSPLLVGEKVSDVAALQRRGFAGLFMFICIFAEATDLGIGNLKLFGRWWADGVGPTDCEAFDEYATKLGAHSRVTSS
jgi:hypothetical protein